MRKSAGHSATVGTVGCNGKSVKAETTAQRRCKTNLREDRIHLNFIVAPIPGKSMDSLQSHLTCSAAVTDLRMASCTCFAYLTAILNFFKQVDKSSRASPARDLIFFRRRFDGCAPVCYSPCHWRTRSSVGRAQFAPLSRPKEAGENEWDQNLCRRLWTCGEGWRSIAPVILKAVRRKG